MSDILLNSQGDISVSAFGDISITESVVQEVLIRLRWIKDEWRLGPDLGFTWFEDVLVKNPNREVICQLIRDEIMQVDGVTDAKVEEKSYNRSQRKAVFLIRFATSDETYEQEVTLNV